MDNYTLKAIVVVVTIFFVITPYLIVILWQMCRVRATGPNRPCGSMTFAQIAIARLIILLMVVSMLLSCVCLVLILSTEMMELFFKHFGIGGLRWISAAPAFISFSCHPFAVCIGLDGLLHPIKLFRMDASSQPALPT